MRVLFVAPRSDLLLVDEEIQDVLRSGLDVTPLVGRVTATELLRDMRAADYDVLWLATHGNNDGIQLSPTEFLPATELVAHVRDRFSLVVLNTCESLGIAQLFQEEANASVICTLLKIPDTLAYRTGSRLAHALAESPTIAGAYLASKPGRNREYLYLPALRTSSETLENLLMKIDLLTKSVEQEAQTSAATIVLLRRLLYVSMALHVPEWLALWWLWQR
jgi:hypothetical protein